MGRRLGASLVGLCLLGAACVRTAPEPGPAAQLALDGEGLRVFATTGGSSLLAFGTGRDATVAAVTTALGAGPTSRGVNPNCGLDFVVWTGAARLFFDGPRFAGWSVREAAAGTLTDPAGIGPGSTRTALESVRVVAIEQSTLGAEFLTGGVSGLLDTAEPDARITAMWAGEACVFR